LHSKTLFSSTSQTILPKISKKTSRSQTTATPYPYRIHTVFCFGVVLVLFGCALQKGVFCEQHQKETESDANQVLRKSIVN